MSQAVFRGSYCCPKGKRGRCFYSSSTGHGQNHSAGSRVQVLHRPFFLPCLEQGVSVVAVSPQHETNLSFTLKMVLVLFFPLQRLLMHCTLNSH